MLLRTILFLSFLWSPLAARNQNLANQTSEQKDAAHAEQQLAVNVIRVISTAEVKYRHERGAFATWRELTATDEFKEAVKHFSRGTPKLADAKWNDPSAILPGWEARLLVPEDRQFYEVMITQTLDPNCALSFISDERGLIRRATALGCPATTQERPIVAR